MTRVRTPRTILCFGSFFYWTRCVAVKNLSAPARYVYRLYGCGRMCRKISENSTKKKIGKFANALALFTRSALLCFTMFFRLEIILWEIWIRERCMLVYWYSFWGVLYGIYEFCYASRFVNLSFCFCIQMLKGYKRESFDYLLCLCLVFVWGLIEESVVYSAIHKFLIIFRHKSGLTENEYRYYNNIIYYSF